MYTDPYWYLQDEVNDYKYYSKIEQRCIDEAQWIIDNKCSIRQCAREFCMSKSQVHRDMTERLRDLDDDLYVQVRNILRKHRW